MQYTVSDAIKFKFSPLAVAITALASYAPFTGAQEDSASDRVEEELIITGVRTATNKLEASVSVSTLKPEELYQSAPRSVAEIFRSLPGIRSESSGGNGNANITIRGIPLATGGSKFMQIHEDGLPVVEFGDINFANGDNFLRYDWSIGRVESIRGGSASTFASNSPGGIINLISDTGEEEEGAVGLSFGVSYDEFRTDFKYGGRLSDTLYFHVGGFFRDGEGVREADFNGDNGGQIKFNITKEFENGFLRFHAKHLDDKVITYLPSPVLVEGDGSFGPIDGYDASNQTLHSPQTDRITTFDAYGNPQSASISDGIESKVSAFGFEADFELGDGWFVNNKFRNSNITGGFISPFTDGFAGGTDSLTNKAVALCSGASLTDPDGNAVALNCDNLAISIAGDDVTAQAGGITGYTNLTFDTTFNDVGLMVNDFKLTKELGNFSVTFGYYYSNQAIDIEWNSWHTRMQTASGSASQNVHIVAEGGALDADGNPVDVVLADNGALSQSFLAWDWNLDYVTTAPYLNVGFDATEKLSFDLSLRQDDVKARGVRLDACCGGNTSVDLNGNGQIGEVVGVDGGTGLAIVTSGDVVLENASSTSAGFVSGGVRVLNENSANVTNVNYEADNFSYSFGGTFMLNDDMSVFSRISSGGRAIADRLTQVGGTLDASGGLTSTTDGYDEVEQFELGYKLNLGDLRFFATYFDTDVEETNADITTGETFVRDYTANGIEFEADWSIVDNFSIRGNLTWTDAEIASDQNSQRLLDDSDPSNDVNSVIGNTPRRQADVIYTITPEYSNDILSLGATFQGSSDYFVSDSNDLKQDAYTLIHLFATWYPTENISISANVNNATDEFVITESEEGAADVGSIVRARPLSGMSSSVSFRYSF